tara:strand:- start:157 stop:450 length:294 start_codon:yes stop_codon:yes gene_type:complete
MFKKNFKRKNLSNEIYKNIGFSKNLSSSIVDDFFNIISSELIKNNSIKITSFGTFETIDKKERVGRNPKNKIESKITARRIIKFRPSSHFKKKINNK